MPVLGVDLQLLTDVIYVDVYNRGKKGSLTVTDLKVQEICVRVCVLVSTRRPQLNWYSSTGHQPGDLYNLVITISNTSYPVQASQFSDPLFVRCGQINGFPYLLARVTCSPGPIRGQFVYFHKPYVSGMTFCEAKVYGVYTLAASSCV